MIVVRLLEIFFWRLGFKNLTQFGVVKMPGAVEASGSITKLKHRCRHTTAWVIKLIHSTTIFPGSQVTWGYLRSMPSMALLMIWDTHMSRYHL